MPTLGTYRTASGKSISAMLTEFGERAAQSLGANLYKEAQGILAASQPLVPVDTGALRSSGYVTPPQREGDTVTVFVGYGGPAAKINPKTGESTDGYAIYVHENLEAHHPVGSAKFLEIPFNEATRELDARLAEGIRSDMKSGAVGIADVMPGEEEG